MRIFSWNVNGIRATYAKGFTAAVEQLDADILCLQETKAQVFQVQDLLKDSGYYVYANEAERKGYSGTAILSKSEPLSVSYGIGFAEHDNEGRVITAEFANFYVVTVYVPNSGQGLVRLDYRKKWDHDFAAFLEGLSKTKPVIVCGDLNVAHKPLDLKNDKSNYNKTAGYTQVEIDGMDNLLNRNFTDSFRHFYPNQEKYSWWSYRNNARENNIGWRLDYFIVSSPFMHAVKDSYIINEIEGSDHCPVGIEL